MNGKLKKGLYVITEHQQLQFPEMLSRTESILDAGIAILQYRNKSADPEQKLQEAAQLQTICAAYNTPFMINDDIDLAITLAVDGVHLGRDDTGLREARQRLGPGFIIGASCYNDLDRAQQALEEGADYIAFGAMFPSTSKTGTVTATPDLITMAKRHYSLPVAAIGGITPDNCPVLLKAGADLLAVISSVYLAENPGAVINRFNTLITGN